MNKSAFKKHEEELKKLEPKKSLFARIFRF